MLQHARRSQQVVNRAARFGDPASVTHPGLRAFYQMWNAARGGRPMPERKDIGARAMKAFLYMVQLYDVVEGGADFRSRVSGADVFLVNGVDMTGKLVSEHPNAGIRERLLAVLRHVAEGAKPVHVRFELLEHFQVHHRVVESVYLPLGAGERAEQIIGLTAFDPD